MQLHLIHHVEIIDNELLADGYAKQAAASYARDKEDLSFHNTFKFKELFEKGSW